MLGKFNRISVTINNYRYCISFRYANRLLIVRYFYYLFLRALTISLRFCHTLTNATELKTLSVSMSLGTYILQRIHLNLIAVSIRQREQGRFRRAGPARFIFCNVSLLCIRLHTHLLYGIRPIILGAIQLPLKDDNVLYLCTGLINSAKNNVL